MIIENTLLGLGCAALIIGFIYQIGVWANWVMLSGIKGTHSLKKLLAEPAGVETFIARKDGTILSTFHKGSGDPVLLIHEMGLSAVTMNELWERLHGYGYRVIALNLRGHGGSTLGTNGWDLDEMTGDIQAVMDHFELKNTLIVGHCFGAFLGLKYLLDYTAESKSTVKGVVSLAGYGSGKLHGLALSSLTRKIYSSPKLSRLLKRNMYGWGFAASAFGQNVSATLIRAYLELLFSQLPKRLNVLHKSLLEAHVYDQLSEITAPVLVIGSQADKRIHPVHSVNLARKIPNAELKWLENGAGNMMIWESPGAIVELIRNAKFAATEAPEAELVTEGA